MPSNAADLFKKVVPGKIWLAGISLTSMAEYDIPYDYFDSEYVPVCDVVSPPSTDDGENSKSLEETIMELSDHVGEVSSETNSLASNSGSGTAPSRQASSVSVSSTSTRKRKSDQNKPAKSAAPPERYDITVRIPKQPQTGEVVRVDPGRKVRTLVDYLMSIIKKMEAQDTQQGRNIRTSLSEQVKMAILKTVTGHLDAEAFIRVMSNFVKMHNDPHFLNFLKAAFPRLARRFLKGDVAIEPFVPLQSLYANDFVNISFDGHFLWAVYREYYDKLVKNGEAPPVPEESTSFLPDYDLFDSDSESTVAARSAAASEENSLLEQEPCRVFTGSILDDTFINTNEVVARFHKILGPRVHIEEEALLLISEAAQNRTHAVVERLVDFALHRAMPVSPDLPPEFVPPVDNTARQVQFLEDVDRHIAENKDLREKEVIIRMGKREDATEEIKKLAKKCKAEATQIKRRKTVAKKKAQKAAAAKKTATPTAEAVIPNKPSTSIDDIPIVRATLRDLQMTFRALNIKSTVAYRIAIGPNIYSTVTATGGAPK